MNFFEGLCMVENETDLRFMKAAADLAKRGGGLVHPNPLVGCVVVRDGHVIAEGFHKKFGDFHAERNALNDCFNAKDATLYVTLEPCCHHGKTPPCTDIIIEKGIARVVVGSLDPNPKVAGKGVSTLRNAGIKVDVMELPELYEMNRVFFKYIRTGLPYVVMKTAVTMDGRTAADSGDSKWITNEKSRHEVHRLRNELMGVVVGINTVKNDDPMLNCRLEGVVRQPIRIIADSRASISVESRVMRTSGQIRTIIAHTSAASSEKVRLIHDAGAETLLCDDEDGRININDLMRKLGAMGIDSLLLEGGSTLNTSFIKAECVDEVWAFIAPKIIGGSLAKTPVANLGLSTMNSAINLKDIDIERFDDDILIKGKINKESCSRE